MISNDIYTGSRKPLGVCQWLQASSQLRTGDLWHPFDHKWTELSIVQGVNFLTQVMPKLHLAYLVEDVEYPRPEGLQASNEVCINFVYSFVAFTPERP